MNRWGSLSFWNSSILRQADVVSCVSVFSAVIFLTGALDDGGCSSDCVNHAVQCAAAKGTLAHVKRGESQSRRGGKRRRSADATAYKG